MLAQTDLSLVVHTQTRVRWGDERPAFENIVLRHDHVGITTTIISLLKQQSDMTSTHKPESAPVVALVAVAKKRCAYLIINAARTTYTSRKANSQEVVDVGCE
jgi:hypothetical protein